MIDSATLTLITAIVTPVGLVAVATINYLTSMQADRNARAAQRAAAGAQAAVELALKSSESTKISAASDALKARQQMAVVEARQIETGKVTAAQLTEIVDTTHTIHTIVNSQHSKLLQLIANLTERVARENPSDMQAQDDAKQAAEAIGTNLAGTEVKDTDISKP